MFKSISQQDTEWNLIHDKKHIEKIWNTILMKLPEYYKYMNQAEITGSLDELTKKFKVTASKKKSLQLENIYRKAIDDYEHNRKPYLDFFNEEVMDEFMSEDSTSSYRQILKKECPIIRRLVNSKREELTLWKTKFNNTDSRELFTIFNNILNFTNKYKKKFDSKKYSTFNDYADFKFEKLEEEDFRVDGVVGMGIKSTVLYYDSPNIFPLRVAKPLFALYFLTDAKFFELPSRSSEFLMIDDTVRDDQNYKMDHNYWYPYSLFTLYALKIFNYLSSEALKEGIKLNQEYKYVYVNELFNSVCDKHEDAISTMLKSDEDPR